MIVDEEETAEELDSVLDELETMPELDETMELDEATELEESVIPELEERVPADELDLVDSSEELLILAEPESEELISEELLLSEMMYVLFISSPQPMRDTAAHISPTNAIFMNFCFISGSFLCSFSSFQHG